MWEPSAFSTGHSNGHHAAAAKSLSSAGGDLDINGSIIRLTSQCLLLRGRAGWIMDLLCLFTMFVYGVTMFVLQCYNVCLRFHFEE
ncbi:hypothetical protein CEXT_122161 [Caerostris extrusa]|uniref:Uncharacterized protein n=1 Tax=Caerostris extrusa TaxID=172846 RepID=A0AAV4QNJ0_CAEEX|nr:hypothetical protein CEXT_122161 [Caerostris extrusa]